VVVALEKGRVSLDQNNILSYLKRMRSLFSYVVDSPGKLLRDLAAIVPSKHMVFPCDIIDLRNFLIKDRIVSSNPILLFSTQFADKYLKDYSLFLVLDASKIEVENYKYGGLQINFCEELDITKLIVRIIVNEPAADGSFDHIKNIVQEFGLGVECLVSNSVPGISFPNKRLSQVITPKTAQRNIGKKSDLPLSPKEKNIFEFLRQVKKDHGLNIQMRVAGGWVRDKLLGKESDDIDIAIDMPGYDFAKLVAKEAVRHNITKDPKAYRVSLEKSADPKEIEPSDDLMVGAVNLFGQKIEFVPMRTEHYPDPNSRQPQITTTHDPMEDVKRRDLTINAIYYNIDTGQINDYVGGVRDLGLEGEGKIILRTPDETKKTFKEDPLRLLRALRFHSRFSNSVLDPEIIKAMSDPDIQESYAKKVSPMRAGPEIIKMLEGDDPTEALKLLFKSGLYKEVFNVPEMKNINPEGIAMDQKSPYHKYSLLDHTIEVVSNLNRMMQEQGADKELRGLMNLAAAFHDFGKMDNQIAKPHKRPKFEGHTTYVRHEESSDKMAEAIMKSIGVPRDKRNLVNTVIKTHMFPHDAPDWKDKNKSPGRFIEKLKIKGKGGVDDLWKYVFMHARADSMASKEHDEEAFDRGEQWFEEYHGRPSTQYTKNQGTLIDGNVVENLIQEVEQAKQVSIKRNIIRDVLFFLQQQQYTGKIDMSFASLPEGQEKEMSLQRSIDDATKRSRSWILSVYNKYIDPPKGGQVMGSNWFKKVKVSQVAPLMGDASDDDPEVKKGPGKAFPKYHRGMRVKDRRRSVSQAQGYGKVVQIDGDKMKIVWNPGDKENRKEEIFDMVQDTAILSMIVAEV
jgi:tRNA nucleotidyltransferase/poly(A) polymerase